MNTWKAVVLGIALGLLLSGAILLIALPPRGQPLVLSTPSNSSTITVYITGAVNNPGVYTIPRISRVVDGIQSAGGFSPLADKNAVNLAAALEDGVTIIIPSVGEGSGTESKTEAKKTAPQPTPTVIYPININTASQSLIEELPGIGPTKAQAIVSYRQEHGPFQKIEDILNVPGIGDGLLSQIKGLIAIIDAP